MDTLTNNDFIKPENNTASSIISNSDDPIAIVGIGCRFPGDVNDPESFWQLISQGKDAIVDIPEDRWDIKRFYDPDTNKPGKMYVQSGGFLKQDLNKFDALFFGITPREADCLDPQQRVLMEVAWEALEDAGLTTKKLSGSNTGVYIGAFTLDNKLTQMSGVNREKIGPHTAVGSTMTILSNRISYYYDLRGPSISVDTACSSSLVAFHYACEAIQQGDCDMAMAGGVNIIHRPEYMIAMCKGQFLAEDGHCKSFDSRADGYARGEGAGIVVLKKLSAAIKNNDRIYAVVKGTGVNQDGRTSGITVPNGDSQEALVKQVCKKAGVAPSEIAYVEAHGTGTPIGDPAEAGALGRALGENRQKEQPCYLSSVKANIGHLEAASGVAGVIKTALSLKKKKIPLLANLQQPNPDIPFAELGLKLPRQNETMPNYNGKSLAGVNSFGYGGTNAHVILQQPPEQEKSSSPQSDQGPWLLALSARNEAALKELALQYSQMITDLESPNFIDICYSAAVRRTHHECRLAISFNDKAELIDQLSLFIDNQPSEQYVTAKIKNGESSKPVFVFTGMGPQWWAMGRELIQQNELFRNTVERCDQYFKAEAGWSILDELLANKESSKITETQIAQPANLVIQIALLALLENWDVEPSAIVGHSVGEVSAAYASGALSLKDAIKVSFHRGRIQSQAAGKGKMLAVGLSEPEATELLKDYQGKVSFAAINSRSSLTLAGDSKALEEIASILESKEVFNRFLKVEVPYHSPIMEPLKPELRSSLAGLKIKQPEIALYSTVTGERVHDACHDAEYWCNNVRNPVMFAKTMETIINDNHDVFVEIGPHPVLATSIKESMLGIGKKGHVIATLRREQAEQFNMLKVLAELYTLGSPVNWEKVFNHTANFISLPHYPWQKEAYWAESEEALLDRVGTQEHPLLNIPVTAPEAVWESAICPGMLPYLADHVVDGVQVLPGAAYVEVGLALNNKQLGNTKPGLINLKFHNALVISESDEPQLRVHYHQKNNGFSIYSRTRDNKKLWTLHASGTLWSGDLSDNPPVSIEKIQTRCSNQVDTNLLYQQLSERGLQYGPWFQGIEKLWTGEDEVLAKITAHEGVANEAHYQLHPSLLDACFQSLICLLGDDQDTAYLPVEIEHIALFDTLPDSFFMHGILSNRSATSINGDLVLFDQSGNRLAEISGLRCQALSAGHSRFDKEMDNCLYQYAWQQNEVEDSNKRNGNWLIFDDNSLIVDRLSYILKSQIKGTVTRVTQSDAFQQLDSLYKIRAGQLQDFEKLLNSLPDLSGIAYFWGSDQVDSDQLAINAQQNAAYLLNLAKSLNSNKKHLSSRLYVVTRDTQKVVDTDVMQANAQWPLIGMSRVMYNELPEHNCTLVDLDKVDHHVNLNKLIKELLSDNAEDEVALRDEQRYTHHLQRSCIDTLDTQSMPKQSSTVSSNRYYKIMAKRGQVFYQNGVRKCPETDEIEIELHSIALSQRDYHATLETENTIHQSPLALGSNIPHGYTGVVSRVGPRVENLNIGDQLVGYAQIELGSFVTLSSHNLSAVKIENTSNLSELAAIPEKFVPIYYALSYIATLGKDDVLLLNGSHTEQGKAAIQIAKLLGATIIVASKADDWKTEKEYPLISAFADPGSINFINDIKKITQDIGVDVILNLSTVSAEHDLSDILAPFGQIIDFSVTEQASQARKQLAYQLANNTSPNTSYIRVDSDCLIDNPRLFQSLLSEVLEKIQNQALLTHACPLFSSSQLTEAIGSFSHQSVINNAVVKFHDHPALEVFYSKETAKLITADMSYLITGGFGGFGAKIAHWLVSKGATKLILVGRRGAATAESKALVAELEQKGAEVLSIAADITKKADVDRLFKQIETAISPLYGIFHAAALLDDAPLSELNEQRMNQVMAPKVQGAWNLHLATTQMKLKHFVMFSSVSSLIGNARQANYVAANTFLDQLAVYRQNLGLSATSVNWGAINAAGMAADNKNVETHLQLMGMNAFSAEHAMEAFSKVNVYQPAQIGIMDVNWHRWSQYEPKGGSSPRFIELVNAESESEDQASDHSLINQLQTLELNDRLEMLSLLIAEQVSETLRLPSDSIELTQPLTEMGIDSLLGVELQISLNMKFGIELSALELIKGNSIFQIAEIALKKLNIETQSNETEAPENNIDELNTEALDELISQLIIKEEA